MASNSNQSGNPPKVLKEKRSVRGLLKKKSQRNLNAKYVAESPNGSDSSGWDYKDIDPPKGNDLAELRRRQAEQKEEKRKEEERREAEKKGKAAQAQASSSQGGSAARKEFHPQARSRPLTARNARQLFS